MLAYSFMKFFKVEVLNQGKVKQTIQAIPDRLFLIPVRLAATSRRWALRLETAWAYKHDYMEALAGVC